MRVYVEAQIDLEEAVEQLPENDSFELIKHINECISNLDFTEKVTLFFLREIKKEYAHLSKFSFDQWAKERGIE